MNETITFESTIEAHGAEVFRYIWRMVADDNEAQDCLQETYVRAWRAFDRLDANARHRAWMYRIATNVCLTHLKRRTRSRQRETLLHPQIPAAAADSIEAVIASELHARVAQAVERLPQKQRAALVMRKYQELDYDEISAVLECSPAAARANVYQALRKLRAELNDVP